MFKLEKLLKVEFSFAKFAKISIYADKNSRIDKLVHIFFLFGVEFDFEKFDRSDRSNSGENIVRNFSKRFVIEVYQ